MGRCDVSAGVVGDRLMGLARQRESLAPKGEGIGVPMIVHNRIGGTRITVWDGEQGDAGGYAAIAISSTSRSMSGYQPLKMAPNSPLSVRTRVCNNKCAPSLDHCICCFLQNRRLTTSFTVDSTNPVAIASPLWYRSL